MNNVCILTVVIAANTLKRLQARWVQTTRKFSPEWYTELLQAVLDKQVQDDVTTHVLQLLHKVTVQRGVATLDDALELQRVCASAGSAVQEYAEDARRSVCWHNNFRATTCLMHVLEQRLLALGALQQTRMQRLYGE